MSQTDRLFEGLSDRFSNAAAVHPAFNHVAAWSSVPTWPYTLTDLTPPADSPIRTPCERLGLAQRDWEEIIGRTVRQRSGRHRTGCMNWLRFRGKLWEGQYLADCPEVAALRDSPLPTAAWIERLADPRNHRVLTAHNAATKAALTVFLRLAREAAGLVGLLDRPAEELCGDDPADRWLETVHERVGRIATRDGGHEVSVLPENIFLASATAIARLIEKKQEGQCDTAAGSDATTDRLPPSRMRAGKAWEVWKMQPGHRPDRDDDYGKCHRWLQENKVLVESALYIPPKALKTFASYLGEYRNWKEPGGFGRKKRESHATRQFEISERKEERLFALWDMYYQEDMGTQEWIEKRYSIVQELRKLGVSDERLQSILADDDVDSAIARLEAFIGEQGA